MFRRLLGLAPRRDTTVVDALYEQIVAAARQPVPYSAWGVPDTPLGRFEMLSLHVFLFLHRARGESPPMGDIAQDLVDEFFRDIDHSIRELGISDVGVPKRMKKLSRMFYGRAKSYGDALDAGNAASLSAALARNVWPGGAPPQGPERLAAYAIAADAELKAQQAAEICAGAIAFPDAGRIEKVNAA